MRQVEREDNGAIATQGSFPTTLTTLTCGGNAGDAAASGNSTCIILNNADGDIGVGQDSEGDQNANSEISEAKDNSDADDVLAELEGTSEDQATN